MAETREQLEKMVQSELKKRGLERLWPVIQRIVTAESGWVPTAPSLYNAQGTEDSWGLFQLNRMSGGLGTGYTSEELQDPRKNTQIALDAIKRYVDAGATDAYALHDWTTSTAALSANPVAGLGQGLTQVAEGIAQGATPGTTADTGGSTYAQTIAWMATLYGGENAAKGMFASDPQGWTDYYKKEVLGQTADTGMTAYEAAQEWDQETIFAWKKYDADVAAGKMPADQAAAEFNRILEKKKAESNRYAYATERGTQVLSELSERAKHTLQTPYYPGTEPGGWLSQIEEQYYPGVGAPPSLMGVPAANLPDAWATYKQAMQGAGLPETLAPVGQGLPTVPTYTPPATPNVGRNPYLDQVLAQAQGNASIGAVPNETPEQRRLREERERQARFAPGGASLVGGVI
jgi:hypothetical protein